MLKIIAVGKKTAPELVAAIQNYQQRLRAPFTVEWVLLPYSAQSGDAARDEESAAIMKHLTPQTRVILLDERGQLMTSPEFSTALQQGSATLIIGGAYGVNDALRQRADVVVSLSRLVFPHQLVRLILMEQIYRAQAIALHHPYHHI